MSSNTYSVFCHLTVIPDASLTVTNAFNQTKAVMMDGTYTNACCMLLAGSEPFPIRLDWPPTEKLIRRSFRRGQEVHVTLIVPGIRHVRELDAIAFAPGGGVRPTLFPISDMIQVFDGPTPVVEE